MSANIFLESKKNKERSFPKDSYAAYWDISEKSEKAENLKRVKNWNDCRAFLQNAFPGGGFGTDMVE